MQIFNYINKTRIVPTIAIIPNSIFTDFKYFLISGFFSPFEKNPAPKDITKWKSKTMTSMATKIPNLPSIFS